MSNLEDWVAEGSRRLDEVNREDEELKKVAESIVDSQYEMGPINWDTFNWADLFERLEARTGINLDPFPSRVEEIKAHIRRLWDEETAAWVRGMHDDLAETLDAAIPEARREARLAEIKAAAKREGGTS